jgi:glycosyltransferase involved in cell wall biosynthesis
MSYPKYNIIVLDISCFEGMANTKRVRNLIIPLIRKNLINVKNLIFKEQIREQIEGNGKIDNIIYKVIGYKLTNVFTIFSFFSHGFIFIKKSKQSNQKNIIYNYGGPNIQNILFLLYGRLIGYKIICDIVEDSRYEPGESFITKIKSKSSLLLLIYSKYFADSLIGISEHLFKRLLFLSKNKIPVFLIPISVNLDYFNNNNIMRDNKELKIFYGGSFNEKDGLEYLIEAFDEVTKKHMNVKLIITGTSVNSDMERVNNLINKAVNKDKILYKGFLNTLDYYSLLNECDIFCMTRINSNHANTGFPFKLGEFLASGKAVVATNVGDVPRYLKNNVNAIVIMPNSVPQLADALSSLIENPDKIRSIGIEGRKTAECFFDSEKVSMNFFSILQSI